MGMNVDFSTIMGIITFLPYVISYYLGKALVLLNPIAAPIADLLITAGEYMDPVYSALSPLEKIYTSEAMFRVLVVYILLVTLEPVARGLLGEDVSDLFGIVHDGLHIIIGPYLLNLLLHDIGVSVLLWVLAVLLGWRHYLLVAIPWKGNIGKYGLNGGGAIAMLLVLLAVWNDVFTDTYRAIVFAGIFTVMIVPVFYFGVIYGRTGVLGYPMVLAGLMLFIMNLFDECVRNFSAQYPITPGDPYATAFAFAVLGSILVSDVLKIATTEFSAGAVGGSIGGAGIYDGIVMISTYTLALMHVMLSGEDIWGLVLTTLMIYEYIMIAFAFVIPFGVYIASAIVKYIFDLSGSLYDEVEGIFIYLAFLFGLWLSTEIRMEEYKIPECPWCGSRNVVDSGGELRCRDCGRILT